MLKIRNVILLMGVLMSPPAVSDTQVSIGIGLPHVSIGINLPAYPRLVAVPGYPVYYAPRLSVNYFFYDGLYWVFHGDNWYASSWYNGPWWYVEPYAVPVYLLSVPVRYYRQPPPYFRGWRLEAPPRWGDHWGRDWEHRRSDWDKWDRRAAPPRHLRRCRATSGSIRGIGIPGKWSGSMSFNRIVTVTGRATPSCRSSIRSATRGGTMISSPIGAGIRDTSSGDKWGTAGAAAAKLGLLERRP